MSIGFSDKALRILEKNYLYKDNQGKTIESPDQMLYRVSNAIANVDAIYDVDDETIEKLEHSFFSMMRNKEFIPDASIFTHINQSQIKPQNNYLLCLRDSIDNIFQVMDKAKQIIDTKGKVGFYLSMLKKKGSEVVPGREKAMGPVAFIRFISNYFDSIERNSSKSVKGDLIVRIDHPDIAEILDKELLINKNLSLIIIVTDEFLKSLQAGRPYSSRIDSVLKSGQDLDSEIIFESLSELLRSNKNISLIFIDELNSTEPIKDSKNFDFNDQDLCDILPYDCCQHGLINILSMIKEQDGNPSIDWGKLQSTVRKAVHFLDNAVDLIKYPEDDIQYYVDSMRKIGVGITGWSSLLQRFNIPYNSEHALELAHEVMAFITKEARIKSLQLGKEKGIFPAFDSSKFNRVENKLQYRNASVTEISILADTVDLMDEVSNSIEPVEIENLSPDCHIRMQAAFQQHTDNQVRKIIMISPQTSSFEMKKMLFKAWELKCREFNVRFNHKTIKVVKKNLSRIKQNLQLDHSR